MILATTIILALINSIRTQPVVLNNTLSVRAEERADYLCERDQWSHENWKSSFTGSDAEYVGENLAKDFATTRMAFRAWRRSPLHNAVLLQEKFTQIGVGKSEECNIIVLLLADKFTINDEKATTTDQVSRAEGSREAHK